LIKKYKFNIYGHKDKNYKWKPVMNNLKRNTKFLILFK